MNDIITYDFISLGEMLVDFIQDEENNFASLPGGAPANISVVVSKNGFKVGIYGKLGDDWFGDLLESTLKKACVDILCTERQKNSDTAFVFVFLDEQGERSFMFPRCNSADWMLAKKDLNGELIARAKIVHFGLRSILENPIRQATDYMIELATNNNRLVSCDVNYRQMGGSIKKQNKLIIERLSKIDLLKVSEDDVFLFGGIEKLEKLMVQKQVSLVVLTLGARGALCYWEGEKILHQGFQTKAVDTTGAGDSFWGAFISFLLSKGITKDTMSLLNKSILIDALIYGNATASLTVRKKGAMLSFPEQEGVFNLLKKGY